MGKLSIKAFCLKFQDTTHELLLTLHIQIVSRKRKFSKYRGTLSISLFSGRSLHLFTTVEIFVMFFHIVTDSRSSENVYDKPQPYVFGLFPYTSPSKGLLHPRFDLNFLVLLSGPLLSFSAPMYFTGSLSGRSLFVCPPRPVSCVKSCQTR